MLRIDNLTRFNQPSETTLTIMNPTRIFTAFFLSTLLLQVANASPAIWSATSLTTASGSVSGIQFTASTSSTSPFDGTATHRFAHTNIPCGGWDAAGYELDPSAAALTTTWVNGGDFQQFDFDEAWLNGLFYVENFDSSSVAMIMVEGGGSLEMVTGSPNISYDGATSTLSTSNTSYNGEGDAVFRINGAATSIRVDYKEGEGANGIFYSFVDGQAVPEPTSILIWGSFVGLMLAGRWRYIASSRRRSR